MQARLPPFSRQFRFLFRIYFLKGLDFILASRYTFQHQIKRRLLKMTNTHLVQLNIRWQSR